MRVRAAPTRSNAFRPEGGYVIECPSLPGCYCQGETVEDALTNITEAIALALQDMAEQGEPIPEDGEPIITQVRDLL